MQFKFEFKKRTEHCVFLSQIDRLIFFVVVIVVVFRREVIVAFFILFSKRTKILEMYFYPPFIKWTNEGQKDAETNLPPPPKKNIMKSQNSLRDGKKNIKKILKFAMEKLNAE